MANNKVFFKRTSTSGTRPTISNIANAELAINITDGIVFSTNSSTIFEIGANTTNRRVSDTLTLRGKVSANGGLGTVNQVLTSGGATTNVYWSTFSGGGASGSDTQVQYNNSSAFGASAGFTFTSSSNNLFIANTFTTGSGYNQTGNGSSVNATLISVGNSSTDVEINSTAILVGNSSANITLVSNSTALDVRLANSTQSVNVMTTGKRMIPIPATAMYARTDSAAVVNTNASANFSNTDINIRSFEFDWNNKSTHVQFMTMTPPSWNKGTVTAQLIWYSRRAGAGTVRWGIKGLAVNPGADATAATFGTEVFIEQAYSATNEIHISNESSAITLAGTAQNNSLLVFEIRRDGVSANDTRDANANIIACRLFFTYNLRNDA